VCPRDKLIRRAEQRLVDLGEDVRYICPGKKSSKCLTRLLTSLVLVRLHGQEDTTFPKQCIHACRDSLQPLPIPATASADITGNNTNISGTWLVNRANEDADFISRVLWTDESHLTQMETVNDIHHNLLGLRNPIERQVRWSLNVWVSPGVFLCRNALERRSGCYIS
jgi:hypothetical protein